MHETLRLYEIRVTVVIQTFYSAQTVMYADRKVASNPLLHITSTVSVHEKKNRRMPKKNPIKSRQLKIMIREQKNETLVRAQKAQSEPNEYNYSDINDYFKNKVGISRKRLNIQAFIGLFIFGWLMKMNYDDLGEKDLVGRF